MSLLSRFRRGPQITIHVLIRGRIGDGWFDVDQSLKVPLGTTLGEAIELGEKRGVPFAEALAGSPHLRDTLMLNGERCTIAQNTDRELANGDELYLLAPLAGG